jgi:hypothetical protein
MAGNINPLTTEYDEDDEDDFVSQSDHRVALLNFLHAYTSRNMVVSILQKFKCCNLSSDLFDSLIHILGSSITGIEMDPELEMNIKEFCEWLCSLTDEKVLGRVIDALVIFAGLANGLVIPIVKQLFLWISMMDLNGHSEIRKKCCLSLLRISLKSSSVLIDMYSQLDSEITKLNLTFGECAILDEFRTSIMYDLLLCYSSAGSNFIDKELLYNDIHKRLLKNLFDIETSPHLFNKSIGLDEGFEVHKMPLNLVSPGLAVKTTFLSHGITI